MVQPTPIVGILLAGGSSSRFGSDKLLHPLKDGTPLALASARRLQEACERVLIVLRPGKDALAQQLIAEGFEVITTAASLHGMGHSLAAGVSASAEAPGWIIALADMPFIAASTHRRIAAALETGGSIAAPTFEGHRGHPVGFARHWYEKLSALTGDEGARSLLAAAPHAIVHCEVEDRGILRDVDTPEDLHKHPSKKKKHH
ncbi:MAG TPA: nucleotidyltransferase family protein [Rhodocyclaceae bacterium]|jgi:molybdenum cofactor cytidylyltransferase